MEDTLSYQLYASRSRRHGVNLRLRRMAFARAHEQHQAMMGSSARNTTGNSNSTPSQPSLQQTMQSQPGVMGSTYDDLPLDPREYDAIDREDPFLPSFEHACQHGPVSTVQSLVSSQTPPQPRTRSFLHHGLIVALHVGNIDIARYLLSVGAPILRLTPDNILNAPLDQQIPLFELLLQYGWTVDTPAYYGAVFLPRVVDKPHLFHWFLRHGANPNLGEQRDTHDRDGGPDTDSCDALERAAGQGNVEAVRLLLDAGAEIQNGIPLHYAAGTCPPGTSPYDRGVTSSKEFDTSRIPVMALLVERGADVNKEHNSRHMVARYAILLAVMAGAVERVRWLLEHGADPELKGPYGSAVTYATTMRSEEMRSVLDEWVRAKKVDK
ncbi:hypothetical protein JMJ35_010697 [Cladonia borealis]|uniref:Ankyrin n=1 Tax=Cladonia borealis TaxID=184061 RepID=A0AA39UX78_9LECA|nr:hypothetical protein JMJ35_010697 [Cladonia borealis]